LSFHLVAFGRFYSCLVSLPPAVLPPSHNLVSSPYLLLRTFRPQIGWLRQLFFFFRPPAFPFFIISCGGPHLHFPSRLYWIYFVSWVFFFRLMVWGPRFFWVQRKTPTPFWFFFFFLFFFFCFCFPFVFFFFVSESELDHCLFSLFTNSLSARPLWGSPRMGWLRVDISIRPTKGSFAPGPRASFPVPVLFTSIRRRAPYLPRDALLPHFSSDRTPLTGVYT